MNIFYDKKREENQNYVHKYDIKILYIIIKENIIAYKFVWFF